MDALQVIGALCKKYTVSDGLIVTRRGSKPINKNNIISESIGFGINQIEAEQALEEWVKKQTERIAEHNLAIQAHSPQTVLIGLLEKEAIAYDGINGCYRKHLESGAKITVSRKDVDSIVLSRMDDYQSRLVEQGLKGYSPQTLISTLDTIEWSADVSQRQDLLKKISFDSSFAKDVEKIIDDFASIWKVQGDKEVFRLVFKHWLWLVKRRMFEKSIRWELMLVLYSNQGACKTYFCNQLMDSLGKKYTTPITGTQLLDVERESSKLEDNYILLIDELAGIKDDAIGLLKSIMSLDRMQIRKLGTQQQRTVRVRATPIATSNKPVADVINDDTGMRRFFQVDIGLKNDEITDNTFASMNELYSRLPMLWKGINESLDEGYLVQGTATFEKVTKIQSTYKKVTSLDSFLQERGWTRTKFENANVAWYSLSSIISDYRIWCKQVGFDHPVSFTKIGNILKESTIWKNPCNRPEFGFIVPWDTSNEPSMNEDSEVLL